VIQFDLEQQIMTCWGIIDDIKCLTKIADMRQVTEDERQNYLLGLETIYQAKFEILQDMFEQFMKEYYEAKNNKPLVL
jgi:hypothetical protein